MSYILSIDSGTTSCRSIIFDSNAEVIAIAQKELTQYYPQAGWVEHDAQEIWDIQWQTVQDAIKKAGIDPKELRGIGVTNQRETIVAWSRGRHRPLANAIVWQDRRSSAICVRWKALGREETIRTKTGLTLDAYFSATKIKWLIDNNPEVGTARDSGDLCVGTIDAWIIYKLTSGGSFITDASNASRTMLFNIKELEWESELCDWVGIDKKSLPIVVSSSGILAHTDRSLFNVEVPISGIAGDQQAALFGHQAIKAGMAKNTYGTGCFMLMNTGEKLVYSNNGLISTIAWQVMGKTYYALEGSVFMAGAIIQWLRDALKIIKDSTEVEALARSVSDNGGVYLVPAFTGLAAPFWDMEARAMLLGLHRGSGSPEIARAAIESIAYQVRAVFDAMQLDSDIALKSLMVDGGAAKNNLLIQLQADLLNKPVHRTAYAEMTALGAAYLAGLGCELWTQEDISRFKKDHKKIEPDHTSDIISNYRIWLHALSLCRQFNAKKE